MTVLHLFDSPLRVARPYESYMGCLTVPRRVTKEAATHLGAPRLLHAARARPRGHRAGLPGHRAAPRARVDAARKEPRDAARAPLGRVASAGRSPGRGRLARALGAPVFTDRHLRAHVPGGELA